LIDYALRADVQAHYATIYPMAPVVPAAYDQLADNVRAKLAGSPEHLKSGFDLDVAWWFTNQDAVLKRWQVWTHA
jgi:putative spermidine/putrescine transport system substrate-binding protein